MRTVMAGGVFNILHPGHIDFFEKARKLGDRLTVVVAHDKTVLEKKGIIVFPAEDRKRIVQSLKSVDEAKIGHKNDIFRVIEENRPDVIALGYDQDFREDWFRQELKKRALNCEVTRIREGLPEYSTRKIIKKIRESKNL